MSTSRWIYIGVLVLAGLALLVDRVFLGRPEAAEAAPTVVVPPRVNTAEARQSGSALKGPAGPAPAADSTLAARLAALPAPAEVRDVFALSGEFAARRLEETAGIDEAEQQRRSLAQAAAAFVQRHRLQTTLLGGEEALAVVDGQVLRVGQVFDGLRLCRVESGRVIFCDELDQPVVILVLDPEGR